MEIACLGTLLTVQQAMKFLIDGYNLLFFLGLAGPRPETKQFARARERLLDWIHAAHGKDVDAVTVVFDGINAPEASEPVHDDRGLHVLFAVGQLADDAIEEIIRAD